LAITAHYIAQYINDRNKNLFYLAAYTEEQAPYAAGSGPVVDAPSPAGYSRADNRCTACVSLRGCIRNVLQARLSAAPLQ